MTRGRRSQGSIRVIMLVRMWEAREGGHLSRSIITSRIRIIGIKGRRSRERSSTRLEEEQKLVMMTPRMARTQRPRSRMANQTSSRIKKNTMRGSQTKGQVL